MPPPNKLLTLGPPLKTRATNKEKHPGLPDVTKPRRSPAEVEQTRQEASKQQKEKENLQKNALAAVAEFEDRLQDEDEDRERERIERYERERVERYKAPLAKKR
jgi:hypothetical protein